MTSPGELPRVVRRTPSRAQAEEWAYVLTAVGILHELRDEPGGTSIAVLPEDAAAAEAALAAHEAERSRPAARPEPEYGRSYLWLAYAILLGSFHLTTGPRDEHVVWFARGSADAEAFLRGEWWRAATALTLHADYAHAAGNLVVGAVLLWALARRIGPAAAAWIALAGGVLGNAPTALAGRLDRRVRRAGSVGAAASRGAPADGAARARRRLGTARPARNGAERRPVRAPLRIRRRRGARGSRGAPGAAPASPYRPAATARAGGVGRAHGVLEARVAQRQLS